MLMTDMAHFAGLVAAGLHPSPVPHSHFVTSTTHKTLAGPRAGLRALHRGARARGRPGPLPRHAGRPADAHDRRQGRLLQDRRHRGVPRVPEPGARRTPTRWPPACIDGGFDVLTGGTDTHLVQLDLRATEWTGLAAQDRLDECRLTVNRNTVPFDERPPMVASGVRIGTPAATMRGFDEDDFREVASIIVGALADDADALPPSALRPPPLRSALCDRRPLSTPGFRGYTADAAHRLDVASASVSFRRLPRQRREDMAVTEVTHPLVRHKLGLLRDVNTDTEMFRRLVNELTLLLTYEATKEMGVEEVEVETPLERTKAYRIPGKKVAVCPILRAGMGMLDGVLSLIPVARVGFIGLYRNEETLEPVEYYVKLPADIAERDVLLLDPMLATGNSTAARDRRAQARRRDATSRSSR